MTEQSRTPASNLVFDLVSIQYHALEGAQTYDKYLEDARGRQDVSAFIQQVKEEDARRAVRCHELLAELTKDQGVFAG